MIQIRQSNVKWTYDGLETGRGMGPQREYYSASNQCSGAAAGKGFRWCQQGG